MKTAKTKQAGCRSRIHDDGVPWQCDRPQGHSGRHQVHFPSSRAVLKSWPAPQRTPSLPEQTPNLPEWEGFSR
jgi:hypothetical protein